MNNKFIKNYILNQNDPQAGLDLAYWYINEYNNHSAAMTYFLKVAESDNCSVDIKYECLCMLAKCYEIEDNRWLAVKQYATFAKTEIPTRPEAYLILCKCIADKLNYEGIYEQGDWLFVYENAKIGLYNTKKQNIKKSYYYEGTEYLEMYYCLSMLRLNKHTELKQHLNDIKFAEVDDEYLMNTILYIYNELRIKCPYSSYDKSMFNNLKVQFKGSEKIKQNYSQAMQDMFVLTVLDGKTNGTYLEIGAGDPIYGNNTKILEELKWKGISIDWSNYFLNKFLGSRKNPILNQNALELNYTDMFDKYFKNENSIDYLSLDIDPAENTLQCLYVLPLNKYNFKTITFEHDGYQSDPHVKEDSRKLLESYGYVLVGENIKYNMTNEFEDWYVHKSIYTPELKQKLDTMFKDANGVVSKIFFK